MQKKQGNERKSPFICFHLFFVIGPFQCVTRDSNEKISRRLRLASWVVRRDPKIFRPRSFARCSVRPRQLGNEQPSGNSDKVPRVFDFIKELKRKMIGLRRAQATGV